MMKKVKVFLIALIAAMQDNKYGTIRQRQNLNSVLFLK